MINNSLYTFFIDNSNDVEDKYKNNVGYYQIEANKLLSTIDSCDCIDNIDNIDNPIMEYNYLSNIDIFEFIISCNKCGKYLKKNFMPKYFGGYMNLDDLNAALNIIKNMVNEWNTKRKE